MAKRVFKDRRDAGRVLASQLEQYRGRNDVLVLALPRGGVPVGYEVATALNAPLDIFVVRKLGAPGHEELAMGAIASGGVVVVNDDVVRALRVQPQMLSEVANREWQELKRREREYRGDRPKPQVEDRTVIVVDDGLATGSSMRAAVGALRKLNPASVVIAVPAAPSSTCEELSKEVDEVVCATTPSPFYAVGLAYWDFTQTKDDEVRELLEAAWASQPHGSFEPPPASDHDVVRSHVAGPASESHLPFPDVGKARFVLLGEASHGTFEFYEERARITKWLIEEHEFAGVAVEADWPDAYRVNRYVRGQGNDATAEEALGGFKRFPTWMWRNTVMLDFVSWLREHNAGLDESRRVGFYGIDLYSLNSSMSEVIAYLDKVDPAAAARARARYACFDHFGEDGQAYGYEVAFGAGETCEQEVVEQLVELHRHAVEYAGRDGMPAEDELFYAQQNARTVKAAEEYYRTMMRGRVSSWNLRDRHMAETLEELTDHISTQRGQKSRIVVWAHNSHLGDARSTELGMRGELNVGQLVRERHSNSCFLLGFTTYDGTVTAASEWGGAAERKSVRPGLEESFEALFHRTGVSRFLLDLRNAREAAEVLRAARLERAIGVIYRPETERQSHYFRAQLAEQFDAVIHFDRTRALEPLERSAGWDRGEVPETYPHAV